MNTIATLLKNKHTTIAALVIIGAKAVEAQWPVYKPLCDTLIEAATAYGLLLAGDAKPLNDTPVVSDPGKGPTKTV